jgi:hypothetical protein
MLNRPLTILPNGKAQREFRLSREQYARLMTVPGFAPATLAQTMGPNWRHLFWLNVVTNNKPGKARPALPLLNKARSMERAFFVPRAWLSRLRDMSDSGTFLAFMLQRNIMLHCSIMARARDGPRVKPGHSPSGP